MHVTLYRNDCLKIRINVKITIKSCRICFLLFRMLWILFRVVSPEYCFKCLHSFSIFILAISECTYLQTTPWLLLNIYQWMTAESLLSTLYVTFNIIKIVSNLLFWHQHSKSFKTLYLVEEKCAWLQMLSNVIHSACLIWKKVTNVTCVPQTPSITYCIINLSFNVNEEMFVLCCVAVVKKSQWLSCMLLFNLWH